LPDGPTPSQGAARQEIAVRANPDFCEPHQDGGLFKMGWAKIFCFRFTEIAVD
jgi:hypothetical protein